MYFRLISDDVLADNGRFRWASRGAGAYFGVWREGAGILAYGVFIMSLPHFMIVF